MEGFPWGGTSYLVTNEDSSNVYATFEPAWQAATTVRLTLQRAFVKLGKMLRQNLVKHGMIILAR